MDDKKRRRAKSLRELFEQFDAGWALFRKKRDRAVARMKPTPGELNILTMLDGVLPGARSFLASNAPGRLLVAQRLQRAIQRLWDNDPELTFLHVTILLHRWTTGDINTCIDLDQIAREASTILNAMAPHYSAAIEIQAFANRNHGDDGKLVSPHVHATLWGHGIAATAEALAEEYNPLLPTSTDDIVAIMVQRIRPTMLDLARVVRYPLMGPDRCKTLYFNPKTLKWNVHESEKGDRFIRYLRMFQLLSRIRQRDLLFAGGDGVDIQRRAIRSVEARIRANARRAGHMLMMRDVQHFWRTFMPKHGWSRFRTPQIIRPQPRERSFD